MADMIIKHIPEDFIVQEVLVADCSPEPEGREALLFQLDKKGYSTFDAIQLIEEWFGITDCASAGLKDSDGVTSQKISVPIRYQDMTDRLEAFNHEMRTEKTFIHLSFLGYAAESIKAARLEGNAFRLRLRDMDNALAQSWLECQIYTLSFPNYFDKQRFGMPGYKKVTHLLGEALYNKDYKAAYEYLIQCGTKEAKLPFSGDHKAFKGTKVKTLTVKTGKLTKRSVKASLKNSKVRTIKVNAGKKKLNKKYVKRYKKIFTKKNAGRKVTVK